MKLVKAVINGFKSFADKTELLFNQQIIAIVGPNGCGKSNVVDAIKWVLGSQSPKSLRSGQMTDVIFGGCSSRKPSSMAEVCLHFSDVRAMGLEQDELEIARRLYRSGESEYLINGKSCRLKDIKDLFMDTGIGVSAYSIIEQGQIDQLLKASTVDRRVIFEEAAGISRFKAHKKEALRKLERTEQNLLRLADIVNEVQKQLRSIKMQAGKARSFLEYSQKLKELRVNYSLAEYHKILTRAQDKQEALSQKQDCFAQAAAETARLETAVQQRLQKTSEIQAHLGRCDTAMVSIQGRIEQLTERIGVLGQRSNELTERKNTALSQSRKLNEQIRQFAAEMEKCSAELDVNQKELAGGNQQLTSLESVLGEIDTACAHLQAKLDDEKSGIIDIVRRTAQLHNEIQSLNSYRGNLTGQKSRLSGKAQQAEGQLAEWLTEKAHNSARMEDILAVISKLQMTLEEKRTEMETLGGQKAKTLVELASLKETRSGLVSELNVLRDMETRGQGLSTVLKTILKERKTESRLRYIDGIVADVISSQVEYSAAVEAVLEGKTDALLVNSTTQFLDDASLKQKIDGRLQVLCMDKIPPLCDTVDFSQRSEVLGRLVSFVRFEDTYAPLAWYLLGKVIVVDSVAAAMDLAAHYGEGYRFVTLKGEVFGGGCMLNIGPVGKTAGLISRKSRLRQIEEQLAAGDERIRQVEQQIEQNDHKNEHLSQLTKELRTSIYEANTEKVDCDSKLRMLEQNIRRLAQEQPIIASEIELLEEEIRQSVQKEHDSSQKLTELEEINRRRSEEIRQLQSRLDEQKRVYTSRSSELMELKIHIGRCTERQKSIRQRIAAIHSQIQHGRMTIEALRTESHTCDEQIEQTMRNILSAESVLCGLYVDKEQSHSEIRRLRQEYAHLANEQKDAEQRLKTARAEQTDIEQQIHQLQMDLGQLTVKSEDLSLRVREELQIDLAQSYQNYSQQEVDWDAVRQEISDLRGKIERLGNVNVDAIDQQQDLEQRFGFLSAQAEDLNQSKIQLTELIERINLESREKFRVTFEQVRIHFQELFRKLFGGGKADIFLENPEDILESGIEIVARPPGKETRTISLLSGGEKTMTAIAMLFAVFRSKPSPFCILDEVDAALDEANNERFNNIVRQFQENSQFIIITHSKRTMSIANILYGITMQTQGISKKICVTFDGTSDEPVANDAAVA